MRRRARLIGVMVLIAAILPMPTRAAAQDAAKTYRIGYLSSGSGATSGGYAASFRDALRKLGYVEGRNIEIDDCATRADDGRNVLRKSASTGSNRRISQI